ncbi:MAG TPA: DUF2279 domain-containing protein [Thermoanaerobaculia bacterium]
MQSEQTPFARRARGRRAWIIGGLFLSLLSELGLAGEPEFHLVPPLFPALRELPPADDLAGREPSDSSEEPTLGGPETKPASPRPPLFDQWTTVVFLGGTFIATPIAGYLQWWKRADSEPWHFANERWFQADTYAGGSDKMSHFYYGTIGEEALTAAYLKLGHPADQARLLAFLNTALAAVVVELGDGFTTYGFSWEDATATTAGAAASALVGAHDLRDTIGFRFGFLPTAEPLPSSGPPHAAPPSAPESRMQPLALQSAQIQPGYTYEIYTADLKLAGFLPRLKVRPGFARYFLFSATYNTRGYTEAPPEFRQRNIGIEIGINFAEICRGLGLSEQTWWGQSIIQFFEHFRVPYTGWGIRYDLNAGKWHGPDFNDKYNPGL